MKTARQNVRRPAAKGARRRIGSLGVILGAAALMNGCAVAPVDSGDTAASVASASTGGSPSAYPVVQVSTAFMTGSGTLLSDSWVLTSDLFFASGATSATVCTATTPAACETTTALSRLSGGYYGILLHLPSPLTHVPTYPALSTTPLTVGESMTCATSATGTPTEGTFEVTSIDYLGTQIDELAPVGSSTLLDNGEGCFVGNTLVAVQGKSFLIGDVSSMSSQIEHTLCGGACGAVTDGQNVIACTCDVGSRCLRGACVPFVPRCPRGWFNCGGYCAPSMDDG